MDHAAFRIICPPRHAHTLGIFISKEFIYSSCILKDILPKRNLVRIIQGEIIQKGGLNTLFTL